jgi:hypothetical protein
MEMKNVMSSVDREENELISFGGRETQKMTRSNNPLTLSARWPFKL